MFWVSLERAYLMAAGLRELSNYAYGMENGWLERVARGLIEHMRD